MIREKRRMKSENKRLCTRKRGRSKWLEERKGKRRGRRKPQDEGGGSEMSKMQAVMRTVDCNNPLNYFPITFNGLSYYGLFLLFLLPSTSVEVFPFLNTFFLFFFLFVVFPFRKSMKIEVYRVSLALSVSAHAAVSHSPRILTKHPRRSGRSRRREEGGRGDRTEKTGELKHSKTKEEERDDGR